MKTPTNTVALRAFIRAAREKEYSRYSETGTDFDLRAVGILALDLEALDRSDPVAVTAALNAFERIGYALPDSDGSDAGRVLFDALYSELLAAPASNRAA